MLMPIGGIRQGPRSGITGSCTKRLHRKKQKMGRKNTPKTAINPLTILQRLNADSELSYRRTPRVKDAPGVERPAS